MQAIASYHKQRGYAPTFRDIRDAMGFCTVQSVHSHVVYLSRKGLVADTPGVARSLRLTKAGEATLKGGTNGKA